MQNEIEKILDAHTRAIIVEGSQINSGLIEKDLTWKDVDAWLEETKVPSLVDITKMKGVKKNASNRRPVKKCPIDRRRMTLLPVPPGMNPNYKSIWKCSGGCGGNGCSYTEYNELSVEEIMAL